MMLVLGDCSWLVEEYRFVWKIYVVQEWGGLKEVFPGEFSALSQASAQEF